MEVKRPEAYGKEVSKWVVVGLAVLQITIVRDSRVPLNYLCYCEI